jgi:hypothetical protein
LKVKTTYIEIRPVSWLVSDYKGKSFCICEADILLSQTYCYRMLAHSHSAMSLYNWANLSQSAISLHQLFTSRPYLYLWTGIVWPRVILSKYLDFINLSWIGCLVFSPFCLRYYSEDIYQHGNLSSSGKSNTTYFYCICQHSSQTDLYSKTVTSVIF